MAKIDRLLKTLKIVKCLLVEDDKIMPLVYENRRIELFYNITECGNFEIRILYSGKSFRLYSQ